MKDILKNILLIVLVAICISCKEDNPPIIPPIDIPDDQYYGTPFESVPATEDIVMYEINLRAFSSTGDIQGVIDRLDNIKDLGVNVIWLMPIFPIGEINSVNSPYSVKNYKDIGAEYGNMSDLRRLTDSAHNKGIAVIIDWVANHTSWDNPWISKKDWYTQDSNGDIIHPAGTNWLDVADLNYASSEMQDAMIAAMKYWIWEANIDGFRCDYADGVPFGFWKRAIDTLKNMPNRDYVLLAEGSRNDHYTAGFDLKYGWDFYNKMVSVFDGASASDLFSVHRSEYSGVPDNKHILRYSTNHDESAWNATPITLFDGIKGSLAASVATIYTGGVPLFYTGQEIGTASTVPFFSNSTINWNDNPDMLEAYIDMMGFYTQSDVARNGSNTSHGNEDVLCIEKTSDSENLLVLINFQNTTINYSLPVGLQNTSWNNALTDEAVILETNRELSSYEYLLLKN
jgi:glycosidase